jgi:hypothetical protein
MRKIAVIAAVALTLSGVHDASAEVRLSDVIRVLGEVTETAGPVEDALVIAFNLSNSYVIQTFSEKSGRFELPPLPSGVYRVIAVKQGFAPAVATVTPTRASARRLALRLESAKKMTNEQRDAVWQARRSIPSDILRELNIVDETFALATVEPPDGRFRGEMVSTTGVGESGSGAFAQTALGVRGALGGGWMVEVAGAVRTIDQGIVLPLAAEAMAEAAGVSMEIRSGLSTAYRIDSTRNTWLLDGAAGGDARAADLESHNIGWKDGRSEVRLRYLAHENLFASGAFGSELFEVAASSRFVDGERAQLGMELRVGQESIVGSPVAFRTAQLATRGSVTLVPSLALHYGLNSRLSEYGNEWAPETGILVRLSPSSSILLRGSYKLDERESPVLHPSLIFMDQQAWRLAPQSRYEITYSAGRTDAARLTASASVAEIDSILRVVFDDRFEEFWDAFYLEPGDVYRNASLAVRKQLSDSVAVDVTTLAGQASSELRPHSNKQFLSGSVQSLYTPTGTAVHVAWRYIEQPAEDRVLALQESERINFRVAQSLGLPLGLRLLVGMDLARALNSPVVADGADGDGFERRLVGGLSLAF